MTQPKNHPRPDGFDKLLADHQNSTHDYEDLDANLREVLRPWSQLSAEGKLGYIASAAALYNVPFERFEQAAREAVGGQTLPAGEGAYLRLHMEYQRTLWDAELPTFPREHPLPNDEPHRDFLDSLDGVLHVKFERLFDDYLNGKQNFADTDGQSRRWPELSAEGKVEHIARLAAIFDVPLTRFTEAVHDALDGQPLRTDEMACLRRQYHYARQIRDPGPHPLPLAQNAGSPETAQSQDPWLRGSIDPMLTELEAFGDEFERLARDPEQRRMAAGFKEWIHQTGRTLSPSTADVLFDTPSRVSDEPARELRGAAHKEQEPAPATVHFRGFTCELHWKAYPSGRPALYLVDAGTRETVAVATADVPDVPLKPGEVFIKDHSENRGMLAVLEKAGIVQATGETVRSGFVLVPVAKILQPDITATLRDQLFTPPQPTDTHTRQSKDAVSSSPGDQLFSKTTLHLEPQPHTEHTHERHHKR